MRWMWVAVSIGLLAALGACGAMDRGRMMAPVEPRPEVTPAPTATPGGGATVSFRDDVRPILLNNCVQCHGGQAGLYVDSYDTLMAGGSRGKAIIPGSPGNSVLLQRIKGELSPRMPLGAGPLSPGEIALIEEWVRSGSPNN